MSKTDETICKLNTQLKKSAPKKRRKRIYNIATNEFKPELLEDKLIEIYVKRFKRMTY